MNDSPNLKKSKCPQCGLEFQYEVQNEPPWLPFCSDLCQWVDLGKWLTGEYRVSKPVKNEDEDQID